MLYHLLVSCMHLNALGCVRVMSNNVTRMLHLACLEAQEPFSPFFSLQPFTILYSSGGAQRAGAVTRSSSEAAALAHGGTHALALGSSRVAVVAHPCSAATRWCPLGSSKEATAACPRAFVR
jgi:hypothetical protein